MTIGSVRIGTFEKDHTPVTPPPREGAFPAGSVLQRVGGLAATIKADF